ncbi:hypothetical protein Q8W14_21810 [Photobacterium damselae subsp. piscicida]|nr:hypothetical protein [Photobacterium damselae subsp. piscicida]
MQPVHDKGLLEQLVSLYHDGDFEPMFEMLTQDFSGPQKLQLKIELRQLMMPINKEIDLRGRVKGNVALITLMSVSTGSMMWR